MNKFKKLKIILYINTHIYQNSMFDQTIMDKKNILRLTNSSYIEFEFNVGLEKRKIPIIANYNYNIKCFKIKENCDKTKFRYKIVSSYLDKLGKCNLNIIEIIRKIKPHLDNPITLIINKNNQHILMLKLINLDCFENIIFGKQFDIKNCNFACMKNVSNVICTKCFNTNLLNLTSLTNLTNLPEKLNIIGIKVKWSELKFFEIPYNTKKCLFLMWKKKNIVC